MEPTRYQTYAKLARAAYFDEPQYQIDQYELLPAKSNSRVKIYQNTENGELVISIRGTNITSAQDLVADAHVFYNTLKYDRTFSEVKRQLESILAEKILRPITLVGHSLGGSMCIELLKLYPTQIDAIHVFNPGYGYYKFLADIRDRLSCKLNKTQSCAELDLVQKKLHVYITGNDPISTLARINGNLHNVSQTVSNPHSIDNFIGAGISLGGITQIKPNILMHDLMGAD